MQVAEVIVWGWVLGIQSGILTLFWIVSSKRQKEAMDLVRDLTATLAQLKNPAMAAWIGARMAPPAEAPTGQERQTEEFEDENLA